MPAIIDHPVFQQPDNPNIKIWRYVDFAKYVAMLQQKAVYFTRLDQFVDPYEGSLSKAAYESIKSQAEKGEAEGTIPEKWRGRYFDLLMGNARRARRSNYASCWHMGNEESEAMWRLYSTSGYAIAIQSEYSKLVNILPSHGFTGCFVGMVRYVDHHIEEIPTGNIFYPIMHKRKSFEHEREVRAIIWRGDPGPDAAHLLDDYPKGISIQIELENLIEKVYISPLAPEWFAKSVEDITKMYGFGMPVNQSMLIQPPYV
jgi:hypothetical protein